MWRLAPSVAIALALAACAKPSVRTQYKPEVDFSSLRTFNWIDPGRLETPPAHVLDALVDKRIRLSIEEALYEQGFHKARRGTPDFWITYHAALEARTEAVPLYRSPGIVTGMQNVTYQEGTLVLDVYDPDSLRLLWRGWAMNAFRNEDTAIAYIPDIVRALIRDFPPH